MGMKLYPGPSPPPSGTAGPFASGPSSAVEDCGTAAGASRELVLLCITAMNACWESLLKEASVADSASFDAASWSGPGEALPPAMVACARSSERPFALWRSPRSTLVTIRGVGFPWGV